MRKLTKLLEGFYKYSIAAILLAIPLYPKFPFITIPGTYVSIRFEDFLLGIIVLIWFLTSFRKLLKLVKNKLVVSILIYLGVSLLSVVSAIFVTKTVVNYIALLHWVRRIEYFIPFILALLLFKKPQKGLLEFYLKVLMIAVFIAFIYAVGQRYFYWPVINTQNLEFSKGIALRWTPGSHINSTFAGHYDLASYLVVVLPIFITLFFVIKDKVSRIFLAATVILGLWLLVNTISRISIVSFLVGATLSLLMMKKYKAVVITLLISMLVFSTSSDLRARYTRIIDVIYSKIVVIKNVSFKTSLNVYAQEATPDPSSVRQRTSSANNNPTPVPVFEDRSTSIRLNVEWPRAIRAFLKNPFLGTGFSSITLATDNDYLRLLGEVGILGFISFLLIFINMINYVFVYLKKKNNLTTIERAFVAGFIGTIPSVLLNAFFIDIFEASKFAISYWLLFGIAASLIIYRANEQKI